jgi:Reverse transcriptase (RNA-dependent DNA polymerase)/Group II intron, maturase-specific domain
VGPVISPCLCNVYLHRLDREWQARGSGLLLRYADDLLALCKTKREAENALVALTAILVEMGLELKPAKTRIVHLREGGEGVDFLGFHHRWRRGRTARSTHIEFLARRPSRQTMQHARDRVRELTAWDRLRWPIEQIVGDLNRFLRGWAGYFRYGTRPSSSTRSSDTSHFFAASRSSTCGRDGWEAAAALLRAPAKALRVGS